MVKETKTIASDTQGNSVNSPEVWTIEYLFDLVEGVAKNTAMPLNINNTTGGHNYVTDSANSDPLRARQRLALPQTPEVRVTIEVPNSALSAPSRVEPAFNMPGGGMERTATGKVPARVIKVD